MQRRKKASNCIVPASLVVSISAGFEIGKGLPDGRAVLLQPSTLDYTRALQARITPFLRAGQVQSHSHFPKFDAVNSAGSTSEVNHMVEGSRYHQESLVGTAHLSSVIPNLSDPQQVMPL
jgi:hypothetical protein